MLTVPGAYSSAPRPRPYQRRGGTFVVLRSPITTSVDLPYNGGMATVTIRELGRQVSRVVKQVRTTRRPTFVTHRGTPVAVLLPLDAGELEDYVLANAPEYVASMRRADKAIARGEPGIPLERAIADFESEHGPLDGKG